MTRVALVALMAIAMAMAGCGSACSAGAMRCNGSTAEICNPDGSGWKTHQDCATSSFGGACYADPAHCTGTGGTACCV